MAKTIVGLFDRADDARSAIRDLVDSGFPREDISVVANNARGEYSADGDGDSEAAEGAGAGAVGGTVVGGLAGLLIGLGALTVPGIGPVVAAGALATTLGWTAAGAGIGAATGGLIGGLVGAGIPDEDAHVYAEGIRRGGTLLVVTTTDERANDAADILQRYNVVDIDERSTEYRQSGWSRFDESSTPYTTDEINTFGTHTTAPTSRATATTGDTTLPVIEEELQVGKREVSRGGVRIHTHVTERPVEEQVHLRQEHVDVERRPVDRPASEADLRNFQEGTIDVRATSEEAVVSKRARVVEEVVIDKDVEERTETIRDSVRRTDVDVENLEGSQRSVGSTGFERYDADFRKDFTTNYANSGGAYEDYAPVYRYGYTLGADQRYSTQEWDVVEPEARRRWEERNPGTWEQFKNSVRYAWDRARAKV